MAQTMKRPGADAPIINKGANHRAPWPVEFYSTAVGKKWVMGLTGIGLIGFVLAHMIGNLKIYLGREPSGAFAIDEYGEGLRTLFYPILPHHVALWIMRIGLIALFVLHVHAAATLTRMNHLARPSGYQSPRHYVAANFASRTMRATGVIVLAYVIFHLFDLSWTGTGATWVRGSVHDNMIASMSRPWAAIAYIVANAALAVHLFHGTWSMFQSLGLNSPRYNAARRVVAVGVSGVIGVANILFPALILAGVVK